MSSWNFVDLFSGIGGFALGARLAGLDFDRHFFSEIEPYAIQIYRQHFPQAIELGDIRQIDGETLRRQHEGEWLFTAGFPCQDISTAGKGRGLHGERSGLWREVFRLLCEIRPAIVVLENVRQLCRRGLDRVLLDLAYLGYDAEWRVFRAWEFGLPHRRERVFLVAYTNAAQRCGGIQQAPPQVQHLGTRIEDDGSVAPAPARIDWQDALTTGQILGEPAIFRVDDGLPSGLDIATIPRDEYEIGVKRIAALGNAIVPQIASEVFRRLRIPCSTSV